MGKAPLPKLVLMSVIILLAVAVIIWLATHQPQKETASDGKLQYATVALFSQNGSQLQINAEVASTGEQITRGLMSRKSLGKDEGMLFIFPDSAVRSFWMKDTLIPLDMMFISENGAIAKIHHAAPCTSDPCRTYSSEKPVKYVLEVNGNITISYNIEEGSKAEVGFN